jgi:hypothetical protein
MQNNAELKGLDPDSLVTEHSSEKKHERCTAVTYRTHSQVNPCTTSPCHTGMILIELEQSASKPEQEVAQKKKISQKKLKKQKLGW